MLQDEDVEALIALRLTSLQARVYLALVTAGEAKMSAISKLVKVARQDIYRITDELQKMGLVERVIDTPCRYSATAVEVGINILLQRIHNERIESQEKAMNLLERHKYLHKTATLPAFPSERRQFVLIPQKEALSRRLKSSIDATHRSIDVVCSWTLCVKALFDFSSNFQKALERGVRIRYITSKPLDQEEGQKTIQVLLENPLLELRVSCRDLLERFRIYDGKEIYLPSNPKSGYLESPNLWSNAAVLLELAQNYFDMLWNKAERA